MKERGRICGKELRHTHLLCSLLLMKRSCLPCHCGSSAIDSSTLLALLAHSSSTPCCSCCCGSSVLLVAAGGGAAAAAAS